MKECATHTKHRICKWECYRGTEAQNSQFGTRGVHTPGVCKDVKGKGLREGAFVR
jgi:hypothetical protein